MRRICYVTGTRADFGLMRDTLVKINNDSRLSLTVCVTGMHLIEDYGETLSEIEQEGFLIQSKVPVKLCGSAGSEMAIAIGEQIIGFINAFQENPPDVVVLLGDRGEMLAGAIAAIHLNIPVVHIHGGERSGTVDESVRHAISKLAHYHFTSTLVSRDRLIRMGEQPKSIKRTGAPGLDAICNMVFKDRDMLFEEYSLNSSKALTLVLFHPVLQQVGDAANQMSVLLDAVKLTSTQALIIMPNADAGGAEIAEVIRRYEGAAMKVVTHIKRTDFLSLLHHATVLVGNSSSGIIEAASLGTYVVNVGDRQRCRERNQNVIDVAVEKDAIVAAINRVQQLGIYAGENCYGDGKAAERIVNYLATLPLGSNLLEKLNAY